MRRLLSLFALLSAVVLLSACAQRTMTITANVMMPAASDDASKLREVAVMPIPMPDGQNFSGEIESVLTSVKMDDKPYYTLVDRSVMDKVLAEMNLSSSGLTDATTAASIGKMIGAKGIYAGSVTDNHASSESYTELRYYTECAAYSYVTGPYNSQIPVCVNWVQKSYPVSCVKRSAVFTFSIKLIEVESGLVVYAANPTSYQESHGCSDQTAATSGDQLLLIAKNTAKDTFRKDIAPYSQVMRMLLVREPEGVNKSSDKKLFEQAVEYAEGGRFDRMCEILSEVSADGKKSFAVVYDLGVCAETSGDLNGALAYYKTADKIIGKPDTVVTSALRRVANLMENKKKLEKQRQN